LQEARVPLDEREEFYKHLFLAMAQHESGDAQKAQASLEEARERVVGLAELAYDIQAGLLLSEAEELLEAAPSEGS